MRTAVALVFASLAAVVSAHFQLQYPPPRGDFVEDDEPSFCDGYTNAVGNRTSFPLNDGTITLNSEHSTWTVGVIISTVQNPTSFDNFTEASESNSFQMAVDYSQQTGEGVFCIPIDLGSLGLSGVSDGANVTIQIIFDGGDDSLYQCADLTLSSNASVPGDETSSCTSASNVPSGTASSTASSTAPASSQSSSASSAMQVPFWLGLLGVAVVAVL